MQDAFLGHTPADHAALVAAGVDPTSTQPRERPMQCLSCRDSTFNIAGHCDAAGCYVAPWAARAGSAWVAQEVAGAKAMDAAAAQEPTCDDCGLTLARYHGPGTESGWTCTSCDAWQILDDADGPSDADIVAALDEHTLILARAAATLRVPDGWHKHMYGGTLIVLTPYGGGGAWYLARSPWRDEGWYATAGGDTGKSWHATAQEAADAVVARWQAACVGEAVAS